MAKRKGGGKRRGRRRSRKQTAALSITAALWIIFLCERIGLLDQSFWMWLKQGQIDMAVSSLQAKFQQSFTSTTGVPVTITGAIALALVTALIRVAGAKGRVPLKRPRALSV